MQTPSTLQAAGRRSRSSVVARQSFSTAKQRKSKSSRCSRTNSRVEELEPLRGTATAEDAAIPHTPKALLIGYRGVRGKRHPTREAARTSKSPKDAAARNPMLPKEAIAESASGKATEASDAAVHARESQAASPKSVNNSRRSVAQERRLPFKKGSGGSKKKTGAAAEKLETVGAETGGEAAEVDSRAADDEDDEATGEAIETSEKFSSEALEEQSPRLCQTDSLLEKVMTTVISGEVDEVGGRFTEFGNSVGALDGEEDSNKQSQDPRIEQKSCEAPKRTANAKVKFQAVSSPKIRVKAQYDSDLVPQKEKSNRCSISSTCSTDFTFSFRFFNYNMGNNPIVQMDNVGAGFAARRATEGSDADEEERSCAELHQATRFMDDMALSDSGGAAGSWRGRRVSFEELIAAGVPCKDEARSRACTDIEPSIQIRKNQMKERKSTFQWAKQGLLSKASTFVRVRSTPAPSRKTAASKESGPAQQPKQAQLNDLFQPPARTSTVCNVDCAFGVLSETRFSLSHLDGSAEAPDSDSKRIHAHNLSAVQTLTERGGLDGMKGKVAGSIVGDLRTIVVCSNAFEEVEDGKVFCPFDEITITEKSSTLKSNPMKCFLGQTFDAACGALRFVFLGTHFPMQKITKLMSTHNQDSGALLPQLTNLVARTLRKILRHALLEGVLDTRTMLILQGDLNSRSIYDGGKWVDLLNETLRDHVLQNFMAAELPQELQGEWREVINPPDVGELPVTYRFDSSTKQAVDERCHLRLHQVYGKMGKEVIYGDNDSTAPSTTASTALPSNATSANSSINGDNPTTASGTANSTGPLPSPTLAADATKPYREVMDKLGSKAEEWGLFQQKGDGKEDKGKYHFKPGRCPSCTERVIYYAPASLQNRTQWYSPRGYEVNYQQLGSDHKPVLMEATLRVGLLERQGDKRPKKVLKNRHSLDSQPSDDSPLLSHAEFEDDSEDSLDRIRREIHREASQPLANRTKSDRKRTAMRIIAHESFLQDLE